MEDVETFGDWTGSAMQNVQRALRRIAERDGAVRAWIHVDAAGAMARAAELDAISPAERGVLHGLPVAVKDVIDVAGMPTSHNSPLGDIRPVFADAPCVALLRAAGAIILGKTDTTEFAAAGRNAVTANPHALDRTPGGSSSGSAAAVADGHVPFALATQTGGSTIRPASFCGIPAIKPTWGVLPREGAKIYANSFDTIGLYAASIDGLDRLCDVYGLSKSMTPLPDKIRIALCRTPFWPRADEDTRRAMETSAEILSRSGCVLAELSLPALFDHLEEAFRIILFREGGVAFANLAQTCPDLLHADLHERVASRALYSDAQLREAYDLTAEARRIIETLMADFHAILTPSAPGVAPIGRMPGDPIFNQMWTMLHLPVVNLPFYRTGDGLPVGLSLVGPRFTDRHLLQMGRALQEGFVADQI